MFFGFLPHWAFYLVLGFLAGAGVVATISFATGRPFKRLVSYTKEFLDILEGQQAPLCGIVGFFLLIGKVLTLGPEYFVEVMRSPVAMTMVVVMSIAGAAKKNIVESVFDKGRKLIETKRSLS